MADSTDILPDIYCDTYLKVWSLSDTGLPVCVTNAINVFAPEAKAKHIFNTKLKDWLYEVETYEYKMQQLIITSRENAPEVEEGEPPVEIIVTLEDYETLYGPVDEKILDLAGLRAGDTSKLENVQLAVDLETLAAEEEAATSNIVLYIPNIITRRQLILGMWQRGMITGEEAVAASSGSIPAVIETLFNSLSPAESIAAKITWASMKEVCRTDPLFIAVAVATGASMDEIDSFISTASQM